MKDGLWSRKGRERGLWDQVLGGRRFLFLNALALPRFFEWIGNFSSSSGAGAGLVIRRRRANPRSQDFRDRTGGICGNFPQPTLT